MSIGVEIAQLMFNPANSCPPKAPTQTLAQRQLQLHYPPPLTICCIHLHDTDKIRVINAPLSLVVPLRHTIASSWNQPIQQEIHKTYCGTHEFKLGGKPWDPSPKTGPANASTNLVLALARVMEQCGWSLILASNVSRLRKENDSLFFEWTGGLEAGPWLAWQRQQQAREKGADQTTPVGEVSEHRHNNESAKAQEAAGVESFTVEFSGYDIIRVTTEIPVAILTALRLAILRHWTQGIEHESDKKGVHEFRLTGFPFQTWGTETTIEISMVIIQALENMRLHGYKLYSESRHRDAVGGQARMQEKDRKKEKKEKLTIDSWVLRRIQ
ncbi:hypothetical protein BG015_009853 [Linnemannia schmuckeri]|uniref:Uncharacterized protein n=1 Tax=Linnemannia schmuckeri TaxID=64567 RepID=A0A9P5RVC6_9FUNG|nr:hypothetical protein BG015_009853 [Linnemannia schmuckeri]